MSNMQLETKQTILDFSNTIWTITYTDRFWWLLRHDPSGRKWMKFQQGWRDLPNSNPNPNQYPNQYPIVSTKHAFRPSPPPTLFDFPIEGRKGEGGWGRCMQLYLYATPPKYSWEAFTIGPWTLITYYRKPKAVEGHRFLSMIDIYKSLQLYRHQHWFLTFCYPTYGLSPEWMVIGLCLFCLIPFLLIARVAHHYTHIGKKQSGVPLTLNWKRGGGGGGRESSGG